MTRKEMSKIICNHLQKDSLVDGVSETYLIMSVMDALKEIKEKEKSEYRMHPMSVREIRENMDENGFVTGKVLMDVSEMMSCDFELIMDSLSEKLVDSPCLTDINYSVVDAVPDMGCVIIEVTGSVELVLAELEEEEERDYDEE